MIARRCGDTRLDQPYDEQQQKKPTLFRVFRLVIREDALEERLCLVELSPLFTGGLILRTGHVRRRR